MVDTPISGLADGGTIQTSDEIGVNRAGANFRVVVSALATKATVVEADIDNLAISAAKLQSNSVQTAKISNDAVTGDKIFNQAQNTLLGRISGGTGNAETLTAAQARTILNVEDGATATESLLIAVSDETTELTTGTAKVTFRMPYAVTLTAVRASVTTAPTGAVLTVDINEAGATILSTKITIDATEKTSTTAAVAPVISDSSLADDAEMTIDIDTVGSTFAGAGLKVTLIGTQT